MEISVELKIFKPYCRPLVSMGLYKTFYGWKYSPVFLLFGSRVESFIKLTGGECFTCSTCSYYFIQVSLIVSTPCWVWEMWLTRREGIILCAYSGCCRMIKELLIQAWCHFVPSFVHSWRFTWLLAPKKNQSVEYSNIKLIPLSVQVAKQVFYWKHRLVSEERWGWGEEGQSLKAKEPAGNHFSV